MDRNEQCCTAPWGHGPMGDRLLVRGKTLVAWLGSVPLSVIPDTPDTVQWPFRAYTYAYLRLVLGRLNDSDTAVSASPKTSGIGTKHTALERHCQKRGTHWKVGMWKAAFFNS